MRSARFTRHCSWTLVEVTNCSPCKRRVSGSKARAANEALCSAALADAPSSSVCDARSGSDREDGMRVRSHETDKPSARLVGLPADSAGRSGTRFALDVDLVLTSTPHRAGAARSLPTREESIVPSGNGSADNAPEACSCRVSRGRIGAESALPSSVGRCGIETDSA
eukprot:scaffold136597_cov31-Tisochrysis_lutea.AAC.5